MEAAIPTRVDQAEARERLHQELANEHLHPRMLQAEPLLARRRHSLEAAAPSERPRHSHMEVAP